MNVVTRGIRNAFRNTIRTVSIVIILGLSIALALAMLIARQAVSDKITSVKSSVGNTVSISPAGVRGFEGGGDALTETQIASVKKLAHVASVTESLSDRLTTDNTNLKSAVDAGSLGQRFSSNSGQKVESSPTFVMRNESSDGSVTTSFTPPVTVLGTTAPAKSLSSSQGGGTFTLKSGKVFASNSSENVAVVGSSIATKNSLKVGSTFTAYGKTVTVVGIFDAGNTFSNNQIIMPLAAVQTLSDQADAITSATVNVDSINNVESVTTAVKNKLGSKADVTNAAAEAEETIKPLENIQTISLYSLIGSVIAGSVIILLTMIMIVRERRREIGVAKAIGASNATIMLQFMTEAITLTLLGAVIGIALGVVAGNPITKMLVNNSTSSSATNTVQQGGRAMGGAFRGIGNSVTNVTANVGWDIIIYGLGAAIIIAVVGSAIASYFIAKVRPAEVMRAD
jgi:putative ABC transport system permease protein